MKSHNENKYFIFNVDGTTKTMQTSSFTECKASGLLSITSTGALCLKHGDADNVGTLGEMANGNAFVISGSGGNLFTATHANSNVIVATDYSITLDNLYEDVGANLFRNQIKIKTSDIDDTKLSELGLYNCAETGICSLINGYAMNGSKLYKFASGLTSAVYSNTDYNSMTCDSHVGEVITDGAKNYLCLNDGELKVDITQTGNYMLGGTAIGGGTFSGGAKKMVKITDQFIALDEVTYPSKY